MKGLGATLGNVAGTSLKAFTAGVGAAAAGVTALGVSAVKSFADYEQLVGGIETLFGTGGASIKEYADSVGKSIGDVKQEYNMLMAAQNTALRYAGDAYKTAGMSANAYMETVTSFAASLKQSTKNELEAATAANQAVIDMSDNANKMGTNMEMIQNAYQGFAKQNYTMLDNLKLGYGGTKEEMKRLLEDAEKLTGVKYDMDNLSDVYAAIHAIQTELGITGTTAKEASTTISGSLNMTKAAWSNLLTGIADSDQNFDALVDDFVNSAAIVMENLLPRVETVIVGAGELVESLLPVIVARIPEIVNNIIPNLMQSGINVITSLVNGIQTNLPTLTSSVMGLASTFLQAFTELFPVFIQIGMQILTELASGIVNNAPAIMESFQSMFNNIMLIMQEWLPQLIPIGLQILGQLVIGIAQALPGLITTVANIGIELLNNLASGIESGLPQMIPVAMEALMSFSGTLRENAGKLVDAGLGLIMALADSLIANIPVFVETIPTIITNICGIINDNAPKLLTAGIQLIVNLALGLIKAIPTIVANIPQIIQAIVAAFMAFNWVNLGKNIITSIKDGVKGLAESIPKAFTDMCTNVKATIRGMNWHQLGSQIVTFIQNGISALVHLIPNTLHAIATNAVSLFKSIDWLDLGINIIKGIIAGVTGALDGLWTALGELCTGLLNTVKEFFGIHSPSTVMAEMGSFLVQGLLNGLIALPGEVAKIFLEVLTSLIAWGTDICLKANETGSRFVSNIIDYIKTLPAKVQTYFTNLLSKAAAFVTNMAAKAKEAGQKYFDNLVNKIKELPSKISEYWNNVIEKASRFVTDMANKAENAGKEFVNKITGALADLPGKMQEIGSNIVSGIWNGISAGWDWLTGKVKEVANSLFGAAKDALDIHSPSRKFKWLAQMCVAGFDEGMEDLMDPKTMTKNINASFSAMKANVSTAGARGMSGGGYGSFTQINNINQQISTPDELARTLRIESKYGLMEGVPIE